MDQDTLAESGYIVWIRINGLDQDHGWIMDQELMKRGELGEESWIKD